MRLVRGNAGGIKRMQAVPLSVNLGFGLSLENCYLLITIMRVQRNFGTRWETGQTGCHVFRANRFSDEGNRLYAIAAVNHRQRIDSQNMRFCHSDISSRKSSDTVAKSSSEFERRSRFKRQ